MQLLTGNQIMMIGRIFVVAGIITLALGVVAVPAQEGKKEADKEKPAAIQWRTDYTAARKEAENKKLPILIVFHRPPSAYCDKLLCDMADHPELVKFLNSRAISLKIDGRENGGAIAQKLGIEIYPTLVVADSEGQILKSQAGYQKPGEVLKTLQALFKVKTPAKKGT